jgi:hypothetical protein
MPLGGFTSLAMAKVYATQDETILMGSYVIGSTFIPCEALRRSSGF